ncbi:MAG: RNase adapter RapZ [Thermoanaerobaculales bacterium]|nr:RNase adapter RapZ [Thermoanaerobaculales bacterium]
MTDPRFGGPFVITGLSGSGKTVLSRSLEDTGYLCVDNIPLGLVRQLFATTDKDTERLAVVLDVRTRGMAEEFPAIFHELKEDYPSLRLIFVEADSDVLLRRYSVARRPHPMKDGAIEDSIDTERESLSAVRAVADLIVDTTTLSPHDLRRQMLTLGVGDSEPPEVLSVEVESFSYLQGVPSTASLVLDVRFLPNPYFEQQLRPLAGDDELVQEWLNGQPEVQDAVGRFVDLALFLVPKYGDELKSHLTIAVGCTGGRHRSVYVAERVANAIRRAGREVVVRHRDKERWRHS